MSTRARAATAIALATALACNQGLEPALTPTSCPRDFVGVCGTVSFVGQVPESTAKAFVVAFDTFPRRQNDLFKFKPQLNPAILPLGGPPFCYTLPLPPGRYDDRARAPRGRRGGRATWSSSAAPWDRLTTGRASIACRARRQAGSSSGQGSSAISRRSIRWPWSRTTLSGSTSC